MHSLSVASWGMSMANNSTYVVNFLVVFPDGLVTQTDVLNQQQLDAVKAGKVTLIHLTENGPERWDITGWKTVEDAPEVF